MESCGIAFVYREADPKLGLETEYLAPDLLRDKNAVAAQLAGRWNDAEQSWRLEYEYPFLHPGLMRALLCDVGRKSHDAGVYWKYGVWVYEKATGCRAILEQQMADERRGRIKLKIQGRQHEKLARWFRERIEDRSRLFGYPELKPAVNDFGSTPWRHEPRGALQPGITGQKVGSLSASLGGPAEAEGVQAGTEPAFDRPAASFFPAREPQVFVSYAWGDDTAEGRERARLVDDLCAKLGRSKSRG
jgi:internalin A